MRTRNDATEFLKESLKVLFGRLLAMEANRVMENLMTLGCGGGQAEG